MLTRRIDQTNNPDIQTLDSEVLAAATKVMNEPEDHLDEEVRGQVKELGEYLHSRASK
jgi:hypothetical protein